MKIDLTKIQDIKKSLHADLRKMGTFSQCAYLDYPYHANIGDHLIGLGGILYLNNYLKTNINYVASWRNFSSEEMEKKVGKNPILFHGGGSLGDLWYHHQKFRESIIERYTDRPIIILPQTIYFNSETRLKRAAKIFNSHGNLTIFARDNYSYELGVSYFDKCKVLQSPDIAFQLIEIPQFSFEVKTENSILYLNRTDAEFNDDFRGKLTEISNLVSEDWVSYQKKWKVSHSTHFLKKHIIQIYREIIQRGLFTPQEWPHRQMWIEKQFKINRLDNLDQSGLSMIYLSLSLAYGGIRQFKKHRLIITNRLHGHILSLILGIPHIFLPNSYYKNKVFYETWTHEIPFCRFIQDVSEIPEALASLNDFIANT